MQSLLDAEREVLDALLERHGLELPVGAAVFMSAAADELLDLRVPLSAGVPDEAVLADPLEAVRACRRRLAAAAQSLEDLVAAAACARAARLLVSAEQELADAATVSVSVS